MVDRFEKFSFAISEISHYWHKLAADEMEKYGLKGPYSVYFTTLYRYPEGITAVNLSELCSRDKSDVSRAVTILENKGLVKRCDVGNNRYRALVILTDNGKALAEKIIAVAETVTAYVGKDLSKKERAVFYNCLESIISNLQNITKERLSIVNEEKTV